jgi:DNA-binding transcriptional LysR family regulator
MTKDQVNIAISLNDIALVREAVFNSMGWALLPTYTVKNELKNKELIEVPQKGNWKQSPYQFGLWWNRDKTYLKEHVQKLVNWLEMQDLN